MNVKLEIIWKKFVAAKSRQYAGICLEAVRKHKNLSQDRRCPAAIQTALLPHISVESDSFCSANLFANDKNCAS
jgi:hypothetical protein